MGRSVVISLVSLGACAALAGRVLAEPMGTAFTYQARIERGGSPVGGSHDFLFSLYDAPTGPGQIGSSASKQDQQVDNGYLTVQLDWPDSDAFNGNARWLEIAVRPGEFNDPCVYTVISPRQKVTPTPYALYAASSGQTANSVDGSGTVNHVAKFVDTNTVGDSAVYESGGNVGIGTTSPQRLLHMVGVNPRVLIEASSSSPEVNLKSSDDSASETWSIYKNSGTDNLEFYQNGTKMTIQSGTGNVGVGTAAGEAKLNVGGSGSSGTGVHVEGSTDGVYATGDTGVSGSGTTHGVWGMGAVEGGHFIATGSNGIGVNALAAVSIAIGIEGGYVGFAEQTVSYLLTGR